ncbi:MAG: FAD-dependent oxidoreductase, partial [Ruthenibacterium sp.]
MAKNFDIIVAGAGTSGVAAAISAARLGYRVLLIERYGFAGGTATAGLVHHWDPIKQIEASGIVTELYNRLKESGHIIDYDKTNVAMPFAYWEGGCGFDPEAFKMLLLTMLEEAGVTCLFHTLVTGVIVKDDMIDAVEIQNKSGHETISCSIAVDCTGDGDIFAAAGCDFSIGDESGSCMSPTLAFRIGGVDTEQIYRYFEENPEQFGNHPRIGKYIQNARESVILQGFYSLIAQAQKAGDLTLAMPESGLGMTVQPRYGEFHVNATRTPNVNPIDGQSLSDVEITERHHVQEVFAFMQKYLPGCKGAFIMQTADQVGIRESRRLCGRYILTANDINEGTHFSDSIVRSKWAHFDKHDGKSMQWSFSFIEGPYYIPYRSLLPKEISNLLV